MRQTIIYASLLGSLAIFCHTSNIVEAVFMFLFFGIVPWQSTPLSAQAMLALYCSGAAVLAILALRKRRQELLQSLATRQQAQA